MAIGQFDRQVTASPFVVAQTERMRALGAERDCAGIISSEALDECLRAARAGSPSGINAITGGAQRQPGPSAVIGTHDDARRMEAAPKG
ncbi:hypothetical protein D1F64_11430 [Breoghania sp. L-A4]|nr:hypothetical protein D1F64_11430 [Breoghania sp. L-A4]